MTTHGTDAVQPIIRTACQRVVAEIDAIEAERDAYLKFAKRLDSVSSDDGRSNQAPAVKLAAVDNSARGDSSKQLRQAFRETVMSVPHYDEEYGESLREHAAAEFGVTLAGYIKRGTPNEQLHKALRSAVRTSVNNRKQLILKLDSEKESLCRIENKLEEIRREARELCQQFQRDSSMKIKTVHRELDRYEDVCETLATERQDLIHNRGPVSGIGEQSLLKYLYDGLDTDCPGLAEITRTVSTLQRHRQRVIFTPNKRET